MLDSYPGTVRVRFTKEDGTTTTVLGEGERDEGSSVSVAIANPDGFKNTELTVTERWLENEESLQNPNFVWEAMLNPQPQTVEALSLIHISEPTRPY